MKNDGNYYYIELLPGNRGQLYCDLVIDGKIEASYRVGSPAPKDSICALFLQARI